MSTRLLTTEYKVGYKGGQRAGKRSELDFSGIELKAAFVGKFSQQRSIISLSLQDMELVRPHCQLLYQSEIPRNTQVAQIFQ